MQRNGGQTQSAQGQGSRAYAGTKQTNSYASSSGDSYGGMQLHSRSASGTSETHYDEIMQTPPPKTLMNEYTRPEALMGRADPELGQPRVSRASIYNDPMSLHLLVETALGDSQHYELLSLEDLEQLKKEQKLIARRIETGKRRLFLETRVHNTAQSLQRLNSRSGEPTSPNSSKRRSLLGFRALGGKDDSTPEQNDHSPASERKKCEDLARQVWKLENRQRDLREKMLRHTAGILQMNQQTQAQSDQTQPKSPDQDLDLEAQVLSLPQSFNKEQETSSQLLDLSNNLYGVIHGSGMRSDPEYPPPATDSATVDDRIAYLQEGLNTIGELHRELLRYVQRSQEHDRNQDQQSRQTDAVLSGLWEILGSGQIDMKQRRREIRKLSVNEGAIDEEGYSSDEDDGPAVDEPFSLQAFSAKVQWLCNQASTLSEQHFSYKDQMRQEREAIQQADTTRGEERSRLIEELQGAHDQHLISQRTLQDVQSQLMDSRTRLDQAQQEIAFSKQQRELQQSETIEAHASEVRGLRDQISTHESSLSALQAANTAASSKLQEAEVRMADMGNTLQEAQSRAATHEAAVQEKSRSIESFDSERQNLEAEVVRLQTELTVTKAELDGAYGTRAERAAEVAGHAESQRELEELTAKTSDAESRNDVLQKELSELVTEYETMVKQSVEAEKERETLETTIDSLRERAEGLELKLSEERVRSMGRKDGSKGSKESNDNNSGEAGPKPKATEGASTSVMRNEFKKMMREARAEHFKTLRAEQEERRKLEATIRSLRKEQGSTRNSTPSSTPIGKSNLSSVTAA